MAGASPLDVAIVGGGITGMSLALGLLRRDICPTIYERARGFQEIGAGIGFTPNAERALKGLDPRTHEHFRAVAARNKDDWFRYVDGATEEIVCEMYVGERGFEACRRSDFQRGLVDLLPQKCVKFGKNLIQVQDDAKEGKVELRFEDGSVERADVVIGCDGINSKMRSIMFGAERSRPAYTHKFAYRGLIPSEKVRDLVGDDKATGRFMHMSQDVHVLSCPVAGGSMVNVAAFVTDPHDWAGGEDEKWVRDGTKSEAVAAFAPAGPTVRGLISLLPEKLDRWAIFDLHDDPLPTFVRGRMCLAGDAAHASAPYHGAGAGYGVEDSLALAELLAAVTQRTFSRPLEAVIPEVLDIYNEARYDRCQALVQSSRVVAEMYELQYAATRQNPEEFNRDFGARCHRIWDYDVDGMVRNILEELSQRLS